jgi:hypothetical protein
MIRYPFKALRIVGKAMVQACLKFVDYWNIPVLGNIEPESSTPRRIYRI